MSEDIIRTHWMKPGTANKKSKKLNGEKTKRGRVYQGEKGIGRYAMLKLGRKVEMFSKTNLEKSWNHIVIDATNVDEDYIKDEVLLSNFPVEFDKKKNIEPNIKDHIDDNGTIIKISNLNNQWNKHKVSKIYNDLAHIKPIHHFIKQNKPAEEYFSYEDEFDINFYQDEFQTTHKEEFIKELDSFINLYKKKCMIKITNGKFDGTDKFTFEINGEYRSIKLSDEIMKSRSIYVAEKNRSRETGEDFLLDNIDCGEFSFEYYIFNFNSNKPYWKKLKVNTKEKKLLRRQRIFLYRDKIRVYPYGEPDNDWLSIDSLRGVQKANAFHTNDQTIGQISISHEKNRKLRDKTNREGLINEGNTTEQFIRLNQLFLNYIRQFEYPKIEVQKKLEYENKPDFSILNNKVNSEINTKVKLNEIVFLNNLSLEDLTIKSSNELIEISPTGDITASAPGKFQLEIKYKQKSENIQIIFEEVTYSFELVKSYKANEIGNSINLRNFINLETCKNFDPKEIKIIPKNSNTIIENDIFSKDNKSGIHIILFEFKGFQRTVKIKVVDSTLESRMTESPNSIKEMFPELESIKSKYYKVYRLIEAIDKYHEETPTLCMAGIRILLEASGRLFFKIIQNKEFERSMSVGSLSNKILNLSSCNENNTDYKDIISGKASYYKESFDRIAQEELGDSEINKNIRDHLQSLDLNSFIHHPETQTIGLIVYETMHIISPLLKFIFKTLLIS